MCVTSVMCLGSYSIMLSSTNDVHATHTCTISVYTRASSYSAMFDREHGVVGAARMQ